MYLRFSHVNIGLVALADFDRIVYFVVFWLKLTQFYMENLSTAPIIRIVMFATVLRVLDWKAMSNHLKKTEGCSFRLDKQELNR